MPNNIDAAFCSSTVNECHLFVKDKYVVVNYAPGGKKNQIISGPTSIAVGFPTFARTLFQYQIDSSFDTDQNVAYIFSGNQCAKTNYTPHSPNARILEGPSPIIQMFPCLKGTVFENGIDAIIRHPTVSYVLLFKGDETGSLQFNYNNIVEIGKICDHRFFKQFIGTVFEGGIDAAFNSHVRGEIYIFKGKYYARYNLDTRQFVNGFIKLISDDWPALQSIL